MEGKSRSINGDSTTDSLAEGNGEKPVSSYQVFFNRAALRLTPSIDETLPFFDFYP